MAAQFVKKGYGQVEANRLTAMINGEMESQAPAYKTEDAAAVIEELENGMFLETVVDKHNKSPLGRLAVLPTVGKNPLFMVYSEKKLYDERDGYSDFVDKVADKVDGVLYPRLFKLQPGVDVWTTNTVDAAPGSVNVGDTLYAGSKGYLSATDDGNQTLKFTVLKVTTLPNGQEAVKVMPVEY